MQDLAARAKATSHKPWTPRRQSRLRHLVHHTNQAVGTTHAARATGTFERRFHNIVKTPLLIIDDFGLKPMTPPHDEDFHDLISERYERAATIVTSNLDFSEWVHAFPNRLLGAATLDRLRHGAYRVILDGESFRAPKPLPQSSKKHLGKEAQKH